MLSGIYIVIKYLIVLKHQTNGSIKKEATYKVMTLLNRISAVRTPLYSLLTAKTHPT